MEIQCNAMQNVTQIILLTSNYEFLSSFETLEVFNTFQTYVMKYSFYLRCWRSSVKPVKKNKMIVKYINNMY